MHSLLGIAPARGKCYKKHSMHFSSQNKEENPLLLQRQSHFAPQNKEDLIMDMSVWYLMGAALVFFMQCGFAMVEAGFTRSKNVGNITMKNLMDFCIGTVAFIC